MRRVNLTDPSVIYDDSDPDGFRAGMLRYGHELGATQTGASLYVLPPGQAVCPYHYEYGEEEWLLVLDGRPSVRDPEGTRQLQAHDLLFFPTGPEGAHQVLNETADTARVLMWSIVVRPTATVYPDSDKISVLTGDDDDIMVERSSGVDYYRGEIRGPAT